MSTNPETFELRQRRWTGSEFDRLVETGILGPDERVELLEGMIVPMTPQGSRHITIVARLTRFLVRGCGEELIVTPQSTLVCGDHRPEPDLAVIPLSASSTEVLPHDARLVVEVADSSLARDRYKASIYAAASVPEYWLVDAQSRTIEVHTQPDAATGRYGSTRVLNEQDTLTTPVLPELSLPISSLFDARH